MTVTVFVTGAGVTVTVLVTGAGVTVTGFVTGAGVTVMVLVTGLGVAVTVFVTGGWVTVLTTVLVTGGWSTVLVTVLVMVTVRFAVLVAVAVELGDTEAVEEPTTTGVKVSLGGLGASLLCIFLADKAVVVRTKA